MASLASCRQVYRITLSLDHMKGDCVKYTLSPEDAAKVAWDMCDDHGLDMPNPSWYKKEWDSFEGEYETDPVTDCMVRGFSGTFPDKVEFMHAVIDHLTENKKHKHQRLAHLHSETKIPFTAEPRASYHRFEMFKDQKNRLVVELVEDSKWSLMDDIGSKLDSMIDLAEDEGKMDALEALLQKKIQDIKNAK